MLKIGRWVVDFLFATERYDVDGVLACLKHAAAPRWVLDKAYGLMVSCERDCGFTYSRGGELTYANPDNFRAVVLIGPTSSGAEFIDTLTHEIHHLAVAIAKSLGVDLEGETPAYLAGDAMRAFADVVCRLGCREK